MATDPRQVLRDLGRRLDADVPGLRRLEQSYTGTLGLSFLAPEVAAAVGGRLRTLVVNWSRLVVQSLAERIAVEGFTTGGTDPNLDQVLAEVWEANRLAVGSEQAHELALVEGRCYLLVWQGPDGRTPRITVESPQQVTVARDPATGEVLAGLKRWASGR